MADKLGLTVTEVNMLVEQLGIDLSDGEEMEMIEEQNPELAKLYKRMAEFTDGA